MLKGLNMSGLCAAQLVFELFCPQMAIQLVDAALTGACPHESSMTPSLFAPEGCHHAPLMKESQVCVIVWLCLYVSLFLMCTCTLSLFEICAKHPHFW